ncbi:MAG: hypothetical protein ABSE25_10355 [Syntrophorhabdales bacterium]|jgi:hypothetical protein
MKPILKWQYEQIIKELLLLQEHQSDPSCPCESDGEMCVRKHLFAIEAYAEETIPMEDNESYRQKLKNLAQEAKEMREVEEISLRAGHSEIPRDFVEWPRKWRKEFESYSLTGDEEGESGSKICNLPSK